jgi:hypothetical protein
MARIEDPPTNEGRSRASNWSISTEIPDAILSIVFPFCLLCIGIFFSSRVIGIDNVKLFGAFALCGLASVPLYLTASKYGAHIYKWKFGLSEWTILFLVSHTLYFSVFRDWIK